MASVTKIKTHEVVVDLSGEEVRAAIEHAAWCAAVDNDPSIAVRDSAKIETLVNGGRRVIYTKIERDAA